MMDSVKTNPNPIHLDLKVKTQDFLVYDSDSDSDEDDEGEFDDQGYGLYQFPDIEMVSVQRYESLTEVAASSPPSTVLSMTWSSRRESWREIPIKDPLVQHAAWAYLLPGQQATEDSNRKLTDGCCNFLSYLVNGVVLGSIRRFFGGDKEAGAGGSDVDGDEDEDGGGDDKVD